MTTKVRTADSPVQQPLQVRGRPPAIGLEAAAVGGMAGLAPCFFYLFIEFGRPMSWFPALGAIRPGLIAAVWGVVAVIRTGERPIPKPLWLAFGLMAVMTWNVPWAVNNAWALWGLQDFATLIVGGVLPLAMLPRSSRAVRALLTFFVFIHVPTAIWGLIHKGRGMGGWMADENDLALALNVAIAIAFYLILETRSRIRKLLLLAAVGVMLASIVASLSRGGFVGLGALALFMLFNGPYRREVAVGIVLVTVCFFSFAPPAFWEEVESIGTAHQVGDTGEQRFYLWGMAWRMFLDHPVFGIGTRNFGIHAPYYEDQERAETTGFHTWGRVAHSLYYTVLAEQGIVGTLLFVAIVGWCVKASIRLRGGARAAPDPGATATVVLLCGGLAAAIFAVLATGFFLSIFYYPILWVLIGLLSSLEAVAGTESIAQA